MESGNSPYQPIAAARNKWTHGGGVRAWNAVMVAARWPGAAAAQAAQMSQSHSAHHSAPLPAARLPQTSQTASRAGGLGAAGCGCSAKVT
jgi:hypothetical protein